MTDAFIRNAALLGFTSLYGRSLIRYHYKDTQVLEIRERVPIGRFPICNAEFAYLWTPTNAIQTMFRNYYVRHSKLFYLDTYETT